MGSNHFDQGRNRSRRLPNLIQVWQLGPRPAAESQQIRSCIIKEAHYHHTDAHLPTDDASSIPRSRADHPFFERLSHNLSKSGLTKNDGDDVRCTKATAAYSDAYSIG